MTSIHRKLTIALGLFTTLAGGSLAFANDKGDAKTADPDCAEKRAAFRNKKLAEFDTNGDGQLEPVEKAAMKVKWQEKRAERLARYDLNKDGTLDESERLGMRKEFVGKIFGKLDVNKDGVLSIEEAKCTRLEKSFTEIDTDKSGTLSVDEVVAARPMHFGHHGRRGRLGGKRAA